MSGGAFVPDQRDADDLLKLAVSRPHDAIVRARELLAGRPEPYMASVAHHAAGIVLRDIGDIQAAVAELRRALRAAKKALSAQREAEVLASLGVALVHASRTAAGLAALDRAVALSSAAQLGRMLHMRGGVRWVLGRYLAALEDLQRAVSLLERDGDLAWTARALSLRGLAYLDLGSPARADADFAAAERLYSQTSQELEAIHAAGNRAAAAFRSGDLPRALSLLDEAVSRYRPLRVPTPWLSRDRCAVLLAAGLSSEALDEAESALADIGRAGGPESLKAELLLTAANCALAANRPEVAMQRARAARRLFRVQQRDWWAAHADLALAQVMFAHELPSARLLATASRAARQLEQLGSRESAQAYLLAGRVGLALGQREQATEHLAVAARRRSRGLATYRITSWLSEALRAEAAADSTRMLTACRRGLAVLDEHRLTLGATELRARSTAQGAELATLAQRHYARQHRPRTLLAWSERWRATALAVPPVRLATTGTGFTTDLAALRQATSRLAAERRAGRPTAGLEREQVRLEKAVRSRSLQTKGTPGSGHPVVDVAQLLAALGDVQLVEIVDVDGDLQVLIATAGRVRQFAAGRTADVSRAADFARFALRRLARNRSPDDVASASALLDRAGLELERAAIGRAAAALREGPVVIVPPGRLHGIPWGLLPVFNNRPFSVAPSGGTWLRAQALRPPSRRHVVLARGPGLSTEGAEVPVVATLHADATVLSGAAATAERLLSELDGAWLGHVAAHGNFRADSPLFSALRMHDGPLTVYDFEQLLQAPYWLVLSSCDVGLLAPTGADELLGLVASLLPLGTAGVVASVVPLNDHAVVPVMVTLHRNLSAGRSLAESLRLVRDETTGDPVRRGVAVSLLAYGTC